MKISWSLESFRRRRAQAFSWLNATQFFGALNDNVFKALIQMFLIGILPDTKEHTLSIATMLFALPYLFLAAYAGFIADRFSKKVVTVVLKYAELVIMLLSVLAFAISSVWMLFALLFLMSTQSALFSPTKYGIVPELVPRENLTRANSWLVMCSFIAIIVGAAVAPAIAELASFVWHVPGAHDGTGGAYAFAQLFCVLIAVAGILTSHKVWRVRPANVELHPDMLFLRQLWKTAQWVSKDRDLSLAMGATGIFSMLAAFLQINLVRYGMDWVGLDERGSTFLFFFAAMGIAFGAFVAGRLSKRNIEFGLMPTGAAALTVATLLLGIMPEKPWLIPLYIVIFAAGSGAGMFIVPLDTFMQVRLPADRRGEGLALNSFLSWCGILLAGMMMFCCDKLGITSNTAFLVFTFPAAILALGSFFTLKDFAFRFIVTVIVKVFYKVKTIGIENVPVDGAGILIANHASYMDSVLLCATSRRRIRFLMSRKMFEKSRVLRKFYKLYGVIPIGDNSTPRQTVEALRAARKALDDGFLVCVFAEGGITRTGTIRAFKRGYERILRGTSYPIIPVYLGGSWGTIYHYYQGQLVHNWFRLLIERYKVTLIFGKPLPAETPAFKVRQAVMELSCEYFNARKDEHASLGRTFIVAARRYWGEKAASDTMGMKLTWGKTLIAGTILARAIQNKVGVSRHVGILLPSCCAGMLSNVSVALLGKAAVNLNFTVGKASFAASVAQCDMNVILTSRSFIERFPNLPIPMEKVVFIEDILKGVTTSEKIRCLLLARLAPAKLIVPGPDTKPDDIAMILFSSGSTGQPKGVMLSHHNVISMIESLRMMLATTKKDHICGSLPFFHSFGVMGGIWYPLLRHVSVTYHTNPLDAQAIVDIVRENHSTMIFGTPTFLSIYLRKATKEDFKSLRFVLAGAEKLKESLIKAYEDKFGIRPYEAYGATELSPGIAVSVPHGTGGGIVHEGWRNGRVGLPVPGIAMKIVDPDSGEELGPNQPGLLYLKGPNVMLGYLGREDLTESVLKDGWYCTGDIALIDDDGFVGLTDRLSRFSKIGGEMVPHVGVEEALLNALGLSGPVLAVTGVPDERKGERLIVLYTPECGDPNWMREALDKSDLPNLWRPTRDAYYPVESIPVLGNGKMDLAGVKKIAAELTA